MQAEDDMDRKCSICQDYYLDPRCMPCAHTFCRRCLTGHILASQHRGIQPLDSFVCPLCNQHITPPDPQQQRFFWARQFPSNQTLAGAVSRQADRPADQEAEMADKGAHCVKHASKDAELWCKDHEAFVCSECAHTAHKPCSELLAIAQAVLQRRQEVDNMRAQLDLLRASFQGKLDSLTSLETGMAAERHRALAEVDDFFHRMSVALAGKREELHSLTQNLHEKDMRELDRKRATWRGMVEEIEETSVVAEMLYIQVSQQEILAQFAPLKQQFDHLQYIIPTLGPPQVRTYALRHSEVCLQAVQSLQLENRQLCPTSSGNAVTSRQPEATNSHGQPEQTIPPRKQSSVRSTNSATHPQPREAAKHASEQTTPKRNHGFHSPTSPKGGGFPAMEISSSPLSSHGSRDRRTDTLHRIKRRKQVLPGNFAGPESNSEKNMKKSSKTKARQLLEFSAAVDSDKEPYGLGDICLLYPRDVLLVAYMNSSSLRIFFLPQGQTSVDKVRTGLGIKLPKGFSKSGRSSFNLSKQATAISISSRSVSTSDLNGDLKPVICELPHHLCCLTQLWPDLVAITSSTTQHLSLVRVSGSSVKRWRAIEMGKQYRAMARADWRTLALGTYNGGDAENVIDFVQFDEDFRSFSLLRTLSSRSGSTGSPGVPLFRAPHSLWVQKGGELVVSDGDTPAVVGIDSAGHLTFLFKPENEELLDSPAGLVANANGDLYVADACIQGVLKLSSSGQPQGLVVGPDSGLQSPVALALAPGGPLYVADFYGGIRVFVLH